MAEKFRTIRRRLPLSAISFVIGLISSSHFFSHLYQLALAPLFPLLHDAFDVSYVMLGSIVTCFYVVSGVCQIFAGISNT